MGRERRWECGGWVDDAERDDWEKSRGGVEEVAVEDGGAEKGGEEKKQSRGRHSTPRGDENVLEGKEEKTRRAIKAIQRQTDALMFLADAVEAKELPGLAEHMRERLRSMKENYHDIVSYEGLRQRRKGAKKAAERWISCARRSTWKMAPRIVSHADTQVRQAD